MCFQKSADDTRISQIVSQWVSGMVSGDAEVPDVYNVYTELDVYKHSTGAYPEITE